MVAECTSPQPSAKLTQGLGWTQVERGVCEVDSASTWMEVMIFFGREIQQIRQAKGLSLDQIRLKTQIPVYQLEALESGSVEHLPEEIFVRGFLNRICMQLGSEGATLLARLPASQSQPSALLADWQKVSRSGQSSRTVNLHFGHLYVGYAALLAGATGGLAWSFQETTQISQPEAPSQPAVQKVYSQAKLNPIQKAAQLTSGVDIAPPEPMRPESSDSL